MVLFALFAHTPKGHVSGPILHAVGCVSFFVDGIIGRLPCDTGSTGSRDMPRGDNFLLYNNCQAFKAYSLTNVGFWSVLRCE